MEDVLEVYHRPRDPERPVVCFDETSKQMVAETHEPIPAKSGRKARHDYEYTRNGRVELTVERFGAECRARQARAADDHAIQREMNALITNRTNNQGVRRQSRRQAAAFLSSALFPRPKPG
jgi:hypothetical protein